MGANGWARKSDASHLGEKPNVAGFPHNTSQNLYQTGFNPWAPTHDTRLDMVLSSWLEMVRGGHWEVDEHGVAGGIEKWRDADTEEHWRKYRFGMHW